MKEDAAARRRRENAELLERMKNPNDRLAAIDSSAYFFPPRPIIKKDPAEQRRIYGEPDGD